MTTAAQLMVKVGADVSEAQSKLAGVSSSFKNLGGQAMALGGKMTLGITGPLVAAGAVVTRFASDLEESANKVNVVFGEQATAMQAWAESAAQAFGLSKQQALEAAGTFGNLFTAMGVAGEQSADMSQGLIQLAADLASFNNIDPTEALEKLRAGLVGEAEPLRTLGVQLSAAAVEARALEMGLAATAAELSEADKVAARYALIMEQTATAQGDFARTSDGLANQMRTVKAQFADAGAQLGTVLLPFITQFVGWISSLVTYFSNLDPEMQKWIVAIGVVAAAIGPAITIIGALATGIGALLSPIGLVVAGIVALAAVIVDHFGGIGPTIEAVKNAVQNALAGLAAFVGTNGEEIKGFFTATWEKISGIVTTAVQVIQAIVVPIFNAIASFLAAHGDEIKLVFETAWYAVQTIIGTVLTVIQGLLSAALAVLKGDWTGAWEIIKSTTQTVLSNLRALFETVMRALVTIGQTLLAELRQAFMDKFNEIKAYLQGISLADVGRAIIQGLIDGIRSMAGALVDAARGVVDSAIQAAKNLLGIKSPSTVFREIGRNTVEGFVLGVLSMASAVAAAVNEAFDESLRGAIETLATVADALSRVMKAMQDLAAYGGVPDLQAKLQTLATNIRTVIAEMKILAEFFAQDDSGIWSAKAVLDPLAQIFDNLSRVVDAFSQIADLQISAANVTLFAENLRELIPLLVNALVDAANEIDLAGLPAAVLFAQTAGDVLGVIRDAVDGLEAAMGFEAPDVDNSMAFIEALRQFMARLQTMASQMSWKVFDDAVKFAEAAGRVGAALKNGVGGLVAAMGFEAPEVDNTDAFFEAIRKFVARLQTMASQMGWKVFDDAVKFAEAAGKVVTGVKGGVELLASLATYTGPTEDQMNRFMWDLQFIMERMGRWVVLIMRPIMEDISAEMVDLLTALVDAIGAAIDTLSDLVDYVSPGEMAVEAFMADLDALFSRLAAWVESGSGPALLADVPEELIAVFQAAMEALGAAIGTLTALVGYVSPGEEAINAFMADLDALIAAFVAWVMGTRTGPWRLLDVPAEMMTAITAALEGLEAAIGTLTALVGYVSPGSAAINAFMADMELLFNRFAAWASTQFADTALDIVEAVGQTAGVVFDGLGAAVETLQAMTYYVGPTANNINRFMDDMEQVMIRLRNWATGNFTTESMAFLAAFGAMAGVVFQALGQALNVMSGIANYTVTGSQFDLALQRFNANLFRMIQSWRTWIVDIMEPETLALVADFAVVMGAIVDGMRDALGLLMDIENANLPTADELQAFLDAVAQLFTAVIATFGTVTGQIETMVSNMGLQIAAILDIIQTVFLNFGVQMQATISTMFTDLGNLMWNRGDYVAGMFMSGLLRGMQNVNSQNAILDAMISLANQLKAVLMAAWGIHSPSRVAEGIGKNFVAGLARGLEDLYGIPGMIEDAVGLTMNNNVRLEPAPQRAYLTVDFRGAYQAGMTPAEEQRITRAMVDEFRRQGVYMLAR